MKKTEDLGIQMRHVQVCEINSRGPRHACQWGWKPIVCLYKGDLAVNIMCKLAWAYYIISTRDGIGMNLVE